MLDCCDAAADLARRELDAAGAARRRCRAGIGAGRRGPDAAAGGAGRHRVRARAGADAVLRRARYAKLAQLRADFVATVTHELKTPIATIRAAADTLASRPGERRRRVAALRAADGRRVEAPHPAARQPARLRPHRRHDRGLLVRPDCGRSSSSTRCATPARGSKPPASTCKVEISPDLPPIEADWTAICLVLDNVIDNAIRYSKEQPLADDSRHAASTTRSGSRWPIAASAFPPTRSRTSRGGSSAAAAPAAAAAAWAWPSSSGSSATTAGRCRSRAPSAWAAPSASTCLSAPTLHEAPHPGHRRQRRTRQRPRGQPEHRRVRCPDGATTAIWRWPRRASSRPT